MDETRLLQMFKQYEEGAIHVVELLQALEVFVDTNMIAEFLQGDAIEIRKYHLARLLVADGRLGTTFEGFVTSTTVHAEGTVIVVEGRVTDEVNVQNTNILATTVHVIPYSSE